MPVNLPLPVSPVNRSDQSGRPGGRNVPPVQSSLLANRSSLVSQIRIIGFIALVTAAFAQGMIDHSFENMMTVLLIVFVSLIAGWYCLRAEMFSNCLVSNLQVLAMAATLVTLPLIFVTLEWHPVIFNLAVPTATFAYSALTVLALIGAHMFYRWLSLFGTLRRKIAERWLVPMGIFTPLSSPQLWIIGTVGWFALFYIYLFLPDTGTVSQGALDKTLQALSLFVYAPVIIPLKRLYGRKGPTISMTDAVLLAGYMMSILLLALGRNSRTVFAAPILLILLGVIMGGLLGHYRIKLLSPKMLGGVAIFGLMGLMLSNLALAMQIARSARGKVSSRELIGMSLEIMTDRKQLAEFRRTLYSEAGSPGEWDEFYVANPFLARFANPKFTDNILALTSDLSLSDRRAVLDFSVKRMISTLPTPLLTLLHINVDKSYVLSFSTGDYISYVASGESQLLGRMRSGSFIGTGVFMFGWGYPFVMMVAALGIFFVSDLLVRRVDYINPAGPGLPGGYWLFLSPFVLMWGHDLIFIINTESMADYPGLLIRGLVQPLLLYALLVKGSGYVVPND